MSSLGPGFDDTNRSDTEILEEITEVLSAQYILRFKLKGVLYLHRITDNRMQGSARKNLDLFTKIIGEEALSNVVLVTTMWGKVDRKDEAEANARECELRNQYWSDLIRKGSTATRFDGTKESAEGILSQLIGKKEAVLKVQEELVVKKLSLNRTTAGAYLEERVHEQEVELEAQIKDLSDKLRFETDSNTRLDYNRSRREAEDHMEKRKKDKAMLGIKPGEKVEGVVGAFGNWRSDDRNLWKTSLEALAAVVSIVFTVITFVGV